MVGTATTSPNARAVFASEIAQRISGLSEPAVARTWSSGDSTARARIARLSPYLRFNSPSQARVERHGGHQVAQNSTITTRPTTCSWLSGFPDKSVSVNLGRAVI